MIIEKETSTKSTTSRRKFVGMVGATISSAILAGCSSGPSSGRQTTTTRTRTSIQKTTTPPYHEQPRHDVLMPEDELPTSPQHDVDLMELMVVIERENESVAIVDMVNHERIARIDDVGRAIHFADFPGSLAKGGREGAYAYTVSREGWMYKLDLYGFNRVSRVRAGVSARGLAISNDDRYVASGFYNPKQLFIANTKDMSPETVMATSGKNANGKSTPSQVHTLYDVENEGLFLYALHEAGRIQMVDYTKKDFPVVADFYVADGLHDGFFGPNGRYFFVASQDDNVLGVIDTKKRELATTIDSSKVPHPGPGAVDAERMRAYTTHMGAPKVTVWDLVNFEVIKSIDVPGSGLFIRNHPRSDYVWADVLFDSDGKNSLVYAIDPETLEVAFKVDCSQWGTGRSLHPIFTSDGSQVYLSLWDAGKLVVLNSSTGDHVTTIDGFSTPTGKFPARRAKGH